MPGGSKEKGPSNSKSSDNSALSRRNILLAGTSIAAATAINAVDHTHVAQAQQPQQPAAPSGRKPNILLIMADDIGWFDGAYNRGIMGGPTPNIDRIAAPAQSKDCNDPTIADLLKPLGYVTCQTGKNHLGDRNAYLPTVHGFDEFYGPLYHLNAEEEPEQDDYPTGNEKFKELFGPRGVLECEATDKDDPTEDKRFGRVGKQTIRDTGPLTRKRMTTVEDDLLARSVDYHRSHRS